jgi:hypothetical protein
VADRLFDDDPAVAAGQARRVQGRADPAVEAGRQGEVERRRGAAETVGEALQRFAAGDVGVQVVELL